jgi:hypothetical protein
MARDRRTLDQRDQRRTARRDLTYPMAIELPGEAGMLACMMDDVSRGGARLTLREPADEVPALFVLRLDAAGRARRRCRLVWRRGSELGVAFLEAEAD